VKVTAIPQKGQPWITTTNADGVYEWYGLPPGDYTIEIEVPKGMRIYFPMITGIRREAKGAAIRLGPESGTSVSYVLMANTKVNGRVLDPDGEPMNGVCVDIQPVSGNGSSGEFVGQDSRNRCNLRQVASKERC
jgi:protocatechuate 3,4-dioxygenase beta subunit